MRRPDIELPDEAAAFVERHPDVIARLAGQSPQASETNEVAARRALVRSRVRARLAETRAYIASDEGESAADAFLARVGLTR